MSCSNGGVSKATNMDTSRRLFLTGCLGTAASACFGQGVATRKATAQPRGKSSGLPFDARFQDVTARAGLRQVTVYGGVDRKDYIIEVTGCGCAFLDYDNDGWLDVFIPSGVRLSDTPEGTSNRLYKNNRDGTFTDVTKESGLLKTGWAGGVCVGDYNNDGFEDLFVTYWGHNVLYHNNGDGTFTDASARAGVEGTEWRWGAGCCFLDYDRDGHLDLFVANYLNFDLETAPKRGDSVYCRYNEIGVPCGPLGFAGGTNILYRNRGDGTFEDVSEQSGIVNPRGPSVMVFVGTNWRPRGSYGMGAAAADFDNDGWPDIYVACDSAPSLLYRNNHDGTFREIAVPAGCALDENGVALSGMGVAVADYDGDGWLDMARTNFSEQITSLYHNYGNGAFEEAGIRAGLGVNRKYLGFGVGFFDYDNDGWKDLFLANGHVYSQIAGRKLHLAYRQPRVLYRNVGNGRFEDVSGQSGAAIRAENLGRGCAFGDFDNDGDVDIVINNLDGPPSLLRNDGGNKNNWIMIKCVGTHSNRSAIGTRVRVTASERSQIDEVMSGGSYYSQNDLRLHFGLGKAAKVDSLEIKWPSGLKETFKNLPANQLLVVQESKGIVDSRKPR